MFGSLRSLTPKVTIITLSFLVLLTIVAVVVINSVVIVARETDMVTQELTRYATTNMHFHEDLDMIASDTQFYVLTTDEEYRDEVDEAVAEAQEALPFLERLANASVPPHFQEAFRQLHERRVQVVPEWDQAAQQVMAAVDNNDVAALEEALVEFYRIDEEISTLEDDADALIAQELDAANDTIDTLMSRVIYSTAGGLFFTGLVTALLLLLLRRQVVKPIKALSTASTAFASGHLDQTVEVTNSDEIGELQQAFNQMAHNLREQQEMLQKRTEEAERAQAEREVLQQQVIAAQHEALRELSTPLLPIANQVLVMPLVGTVDSTRAQMIMETLLAGVAEHHANLVILDITGVKVVDTQVANAFVEAAQAVKLLGAQVMMTGIQPPIAQTLIALGADLRGITTSSTLQAGITMALTNGNGNGHGRSR